jgi:hypothetical protein
MDPFSATRPRGGGHPDDRDAEGTADLLGGGQHAGRRAGVPVPGTGDPRSAAGSG